MLYLAVIYIFYIKFYFTTDVVMFAFCIRDSVKIQVQLRPRKQLQRYMASNCP